MCTITKLVSHFFLGNKKNQIESSEGGMDFSKGLICTIPTEECKYFIDSYATMTFDFYFYFVFPENTVCILSLLPFYFLFLLFINRFTCLANFLFVGLSLLLFFQIDNRI